MSRVFQELGEAATEIKRDLAKGPILRSTRVQHYDNIEIFGRERTGYEYTIMDGGMPFAPEDLLLLGQHYGFKPYIDHPHEMGSWLRAELHDRLYPRHDLHISSAMTPTESINPLLQGMIEGKWPSYTYRERLVGARNAMTTALNVSPDSRRAFWPIFTPQDAVRAAAPTRIPCSLGYEVMIREVEGEPKLQMFYLSRSCDFDRFWLSDIWFAYRFGCEIAASVGVEMGAVHHYIISLHSFTAGVEEIY